MTGISARVDDAPPLPDVTPLQVQRLLAGATTVALERTAAPHGSAVARRDGPQAWAVRVADDTGRVRLTRAPNGDAVYDLLRSWAADDGWWAGAFDWAPPD